MNVKYFNNVETRIDLLLRELPPKLRKTLSTMKFASVDELMKKVERKVLAETDNGEDKNRSCELFQTELKAREEQKDAEKTGLTDFYKDGPIEMSSINFNRNQNGNNNFQNRNGLLRLKTSVSLWDGNLQSDGNYRSNRWLSN